VGKVSSGLVGGAKVGVAGVKAVVKVAPLASGEGGRVALQTVGFDVTAERILFHDVVSFEGLPPGGCSLKVLWLQ